MMKINRDRSIAFLMLLPSLAVLAVFVYFFIFRAISTSTSDWGNEPFLNPPLAEDVKIEQIGLQNYKNLMTGILDFPFRNSVVNTFFFTVFFVIGCLGVGLVLALLLDQKIVGEGFFRTVFLFPMALSFVVTGTIWRWMLQPGGGVNILPQKLLGLSPIKFGWMNSRDVWLPFDWADTPRYVTFLGLAILAFMAVHYASNRRRRALQLTGAAAAVIILIFVAGLWDKVWLPLDLPEGESKKGFNAALVGVILAAVWQMSGYTMAMLIAGIRGIPEELREAARVDGCTELGVYRRVVLPQLSPIILSAMIILGHISLKIFDLVFAMSGPDNAQTVVPGILVYTQGFRQNAFAKASAIAVIMLFLVALVIIPYLWTQLRNND
jgi:glucose/mannose transport system permease protein